MLDDLRAERVQEAGRLVVILSGELDLATADFAEQVMSDPFDLLDLTEVSFMDSVGIRALVRICAGRSEPLTVRGARPTIRRTLDLAGLTERFVFVDATDRAASSH